MLSADPGPVRFATPSSNSHYVKSALKDRLNDFSVFLGKTEGLIEVRMHNL